MDWLIKALGGIPRHEMELQKVVEESWRQRAIAAETTVTLFKEIMTRDQARLDNMLEKKQQPQQMPPDLKPLGDRRMSSWPRIRRELENQNRVRANAQVSREEIEKQVREG